MADALTLQAILIQISNLKIWMTTNASVMSCIVERTAKV